MASLKSNLYSMPYLLSLLLLLAYCSRTPGISSTPPAHKAIAFNLDGHTIVLADSATAAYRLNLDQHDRFFESISQLDIAIQMQKPVNTWPTHAAAVKAYRVFLAQHARSFHKAEENLARDAMKSAWTNTKSLNPELLPDTLYLLKVSGQGYGSSAFYTRNKSVIIPSDQLAENTDVNRLAQVMVHEMFHVYSRFHPQTRAQLYGHIGFQAIGKDADLVIPKVLQELRLTNPDGVSPAWAISLKATDGTSFQAVPFLVSKYPDFNAKAPEFFAYLGFKLYPVAKNAKGHYEVSCKEDGESPLTMNKQTDFFRQLTDNTGYIIHPDEVMADQLVLLSQPAAQRKSLKHGNGLSPEGIELLQKVEDTLKKSQEKAIR